jgi:hypothetical protein
MIMTRTNKRVAIERKLLLASLYNFKNREENSDN